MVFTLLHDVEGVVKELVKEVGVKFCGKDRLIIGATVTGFPISTGVDVTKVGLFWVVVI